MVRNSPLVRFRAFRGTAKLHLGGLSVPLLDCGHIATGPSQAA
jgi:hypothetical protein